MRAPPFFRSCHMHWLSNTLCTFDQSLPRAGIDNVGCLYRKFIIASMRALSSVCTIVYKLSHGLYVPMTSLPQADILANGHINSMR